MSRSLEVLTSGILPCESGMLKVWKAGSLDIQLEASTTEVWTSGIPDDLEPGSPEVWKAGRLDIQEVHFPPRPLSKLPFRALLPTPRVEASPLPLP